MGLLSGAYKVSQAFVRNELRYKPLGRTASRAVKEILVANRVSYRTVEIWLGLAEPQNLGCLVFVRTDAEKAQLVAAGHLPRLTSAFKAALSKLSYPIDAIPLVEVSVHSDEEIGRVGNYEYFK